MQYPLRHLQDGGETNEVLNQMETISFDGDRAHRGAPQQRGFLGLVEHVPSVFLPLFDEEFYRTFRLNSSWLTLRYANDEVESDFLRFFDAFRTALVRHFTMLGSCALIIVILALAENPISRYILVAILLLFGAVTAIDMYLTYMGPRPKDAEAEEAIALRNEMMLGGMIACGAWGYAALFYPTKQERCETWKPVAGPEHPEYCFHAISSEAVMFFVMAMLLIRWHLGIGICVLFIAIKYIVRLFNPVDTATEAGAKFAWDACIFLLVGACGREYELNSRRRFEEYAVLTIHKARLEDAHGKIGQHLDQLLPPHLHRKLLSQAPVADVAVCTIFLSQVVNFPSWFATTVPKHALKKYTRLLWTLDAAAAKFRSLHKLRTAGDNFIVVANLLDHEAYHATVVLAFADYCRQTVFCDEGSGGVGVPMQSAVHTSRGVGLIAGTQFIRYVISGDAIDGTWHAVRQSAASRVVLTPQVLASESCIRPSIEVEIHAVGGDSAEPPIFALKSIDKSVADCAAIDPAALFRFDPLRTDVHRSAGGEVPDRLTVAELPDNPLRSEGSDVSSSHSKHSGTSTSATKTTNTSQMLLAGDAQSRLALLLRRLVGQSAESIDIGGAVIQREELEHKRELIRQMGTQIQVVSSCGFLRFRDVGHESAFESWLQEVPLMHNLTPLILPVALFIAAVAERGFLEIIFQLIGFALSTIFAASRFFLSSRPVLSLGLFEASVILNTISAAACTRSFVGNDILYLWTVHAYLTIYVARPITYVATALLILSLSALNFVLLFLLEDMRILVVTAPSAVFAFLEMLMATREMERARRFAFMAFFITSQAVAVAKCDEATYLHVLYATIPRPIVDLLIASRRDNHMQAHGTDGSGGRGAPALLSDFGDCVMKHIEDTVVCRIRVERLHEAVQDAVDDTDLLAEITESQQQWIEEYASRCKALCLIEVDGDTLMLAGPLVDTTEERSFVAATEAAALAVQCYIRNKFGTRSAYSLHKSSTSRIPLAKETKEGAHSLSPMYTCVLVAGETFGIIVESALTQYQLLGYAVYCAVAIQDAAPAGSCVATEKCIRRYLKLMTTPEKENSIGSDEPTPAPTVSLPAAADTNNTPSFGDVTTWSIRGIGAMRIAQLKQ